MFRPTLFVHSFLLITKNYVVLLCNASARKMYYYTSAAESRPSPETVQRSNNNAECVFVQFEMTIVFFSIHVNDNLSIDVA